MGKNVTYLHLNLHFLIKFKPPIGFINAYLLNLKNTFEVFIMFFLLNPR